MDPTGLLDILHREWPVVKQAPYSFSISLLVMVVIVWALFEWRHRKRLEKLKERLARDTGTNSATVKDSGNSTAMGGTAKIEQKIYRGGEQPVKVAAVEPEEVPVLEFNQQDWTLLDANNNRSNSVRREDIGSHLLTARFKNPRRGSGRTTPSAYRVHAQLTFRTSSHKEICVHHGHWIDRYEHFHDFAPGEVRELVVLLVFGNHLLYTLENRNSRDPRKGRMRSGMTMLFGPQPTMLPLDVYAVEIALMSGDATLFEKTFVLTREPDGAMRLVA